MKGIIIVDIPEKDCRGCQCFGESYNYCGAIHKYIDPIVGKFPEWCPIRLVPEKKNMKNASTFTDLGFINGWNACLDEILKEK